MGKKKEKPFYDASILLMNISIFNFSRFYGSFTSLYMLLINHFHYSIICITLIITSSISELKIQVYQCILIYVCKSCTKLYTMKDTIVAPFPSSSCFVFIEGFSLKKK